MKLERIGAGEYRTADGLTIRDTNDPSGAPHTRYARSTSRWLACDASGAIVAKAPTLTRMRETLDRRAGR